MGRQFDNATRQLFHYDEEADRSHCKLCGRSLKGSYLTNLLRHISVRHKELMVEGSKRRVKVERVNKLLQSCGKSSGTIPDDNYEQEDCEPSAGHIENALAVEIEEVKKEDEETEVEADSGVSVGAPDYNAVQTTPSDDSLPMLSIPTKRIRLVSPDLSPAEVNQINSIPSKTLPRKSKISASGHRLRSTVNVINAQKMFVEVLNVVREQNLGRQEFEKQMLAYQKEMVECTKTVALSLNNIGCGLNSIGNALLQFAQAMKKN